MAIRNALVLLSGQLQELPTGDTLAGAAASGIAVRLNPRQITEDLVVTSAYNAASVGPITVSDGVTVTLGDGATWSIH